MGAGRGSGAEIDSAAPNAPIRRADVGRSHAGDLHFVWPLEGGIVDFDRPIPFVVVSAEGAPLDQVEVRAVIGHDSHTHPGRATTGGRGELALARDETHLYMEDHFAALEVRRGGADAREPAARLRLQPRRLQAEHAYSFANATRRVRGSLRERIDVQVWLRAGNGGHARYGPVNLRHIESLTLAVVPAAGGEVEVRVDGVDGALLARIPVPAAPEAAAPGGPPVPQVELRAPISDPGGSHDLYLVFHGPAEQTLMDIDWIEFNGPGMMRAPQP